jgi:SOS-response transcriptional repressor LexA
MKACASRKPLRLLLVVADPSPPDGTIVAALIGGERARAKHLFREGENGRLKAENGEHSINLSGALTR